MFFVPFDPFTPYIQGRELAIDENWEDPQEASQTIDAQLANLFNIDTYVPRTADTWTTAGRNQLSLASDARASELESLLQPGNMARASAQTRYWAENAYPFAQEAYAAQRAGMGYDIAMSQAAERSLALQEQEYRRALAGQRGLAVLRTLLPYIPAQMPATQTTPAASATPAAPAVPVAPTGQYGWTIRPNGLPSSRPLIPAGDTPSLARNLK